jgi:hypothetical protein
MMTMVMPRFLDLLEQVDGVVGVGARHAGGRFVEQQKLGFLDRHMAISSRRLSPRDSEPAMHVALGRHVDFFQHGFGFLDDRLLALDALHRVHPERPSRLAKQGISMFSSTVRSVKISGVWNTRLMPIWLISNGLRPEHGLAVEHDRSGVRDQLADQQFSSVDLPAPFGPMMAWTDFSFTIQVHVAQACRPPKRLLTPLTSRIPMVQTPLSRVRPGVWGDALGPCRSGPSCA